jgi:hypothetical protein
MWWFSNLKPDEYLQRRHSRYQDLIVDLIDHLLIVDHIDHADDDAVDHDATATKDQSASTV